MNSFYPWHSDPLTGLLNRWQSAQMPHALLLTGIEGIGKIHFAQQFARLLMCERCHADMRASTSAPSELSPCGVCQGCKLMKAGSHPDYQAVYSDEGKAIPIDTIRSVSTLLTLKSQLAAQQVVIIAPADKMNRFSANSLLKTLEEPTPDTLLMLVTNRPDSLLPTIRSRCQMITFHRPALEQATQWLRDQLLKTSDMGAVIDERQLQSLLLLSDRAPLKALEYAKSGALQIREKMIASLEQLSRQQLDPITEAKSWTDAGVTQSIKWLMLWTMDMIRLKSGAVVVDTFDTNHAEKGADPVQGRLKNLSEKIDLHSLFDYLDKLTRNTRLLDTQVNQQLMMEDLLISWCRLSRTG